MGTPEILLVKRFHGDGASFPAPEEVPGEKENQGDPGQPLPGLSTGESIHFHLPGIRVPQAVHFPWSI